MAEYNRYMDFSEGHLFNFTHTVFLHINVIHQHSCWWEFGVIKAYSIKRELQGIVMIILNFKQK